MQGVLPTLHMMLVAMHIADLPLLKRNLARFMLFLGAPKAADDYECHPWGDRGR